MKGTGNVDFPRGNKNAKMFYCVDGWMDGWVDGWVGGDFLPPSIFFIFKFRNKQLALVLKMCLKMASAY